jgi:hypothetical protein
MTYNVDSFSGDRTIVIEEGTIDSTFDLRLIGKNYAGYGEIQNENFLHLLENFAGNTAPPRPINGQIWYDNLTKRIRYYDATTQRWRGTGGIEASVTPPINPSEGDLWWKTDVKQLFAWDGLDWALVGPESLGGYGKTRMESRILTDIQDLPHPVIIAYVDGEPMYVISKDEEFTLSSASILILGGSAKYGRIKSGITLINSNNDDGVTGNNRIVWGTSSHALNSDTADLAELAILALSSNNLTSGEQGSVPYQVTSGSTSFVETNKTTTRKILAQIGNGTIANVPEWIILPTVLPIEKADGSIISIPLSNGTFPVQRRDGTSITVTVQ